MMTPITKTLAAILAITFGATPAQACYNTSGWTEFYIGSYTIRYYSASSQSYHRDFYAAAAQRCADYAHNVYFDDPDQANMVSRQCRAHMLNHFNQFSGQFCADQY